MRRLLAALAVAAAALVSIAAPAVAAEARPAVAGCSYNYNWHVGAGYSQVWLSAVSCRGGDYVIVYNRTGCGYIRGPAGEYCFNGPTRTGDGSQSSNNSQVTCNQHPYGVVVDVYVFSKVQGPNPSGWFSDHVYHQ